MRVLSLILLLLLSSQGYSADIRYVELGIALPESTGLTGGLTIDVDQDGNADVRLRTTRTSSPFSPDLWTVEFVRQSGAINIFWAGTDDLQSLDKLPEGVLIEDSLTDYLANEGRVIWGYNVPLGSDVIAFANNLDWVASPGYVAMKVQTPSGELFGYVQLDLSAYAMGSSSVEAIIVDYAFATVSGLTLRTGDPTCSTPAVPTGLQAIPLSPSEVQLSWNEQSDADRFRLRGSDSTGILGLRFPQDTVITISGLHAGQTYGFDVTAQCNNRGELVQSMRSERVLFSLPMLRVESGSWTIITLDGRVLVSGESEEDLTKEMTRLPPGWYLILESGKGRLLLR